MATTTTITASACLVFLAQLTFGSDLQSKAMVDFRITEMVPDQTNCNASATVCVQIAPIGYSVNFSGQFPTGAKPILGVTVFGGPNSVQIPVVYANEATTFANPMVGIFETPTLASNAALSFTVTLEGATIAAASNLVMGTAGTDCIPNTLCFLINGNNILLWGTRGSQSTIDVVGTGNQKAVIPLIEKAINGGSAVPQLLAVPADGLIQGFALIAISFEPTSIVPNGGEIVNSPDCPASKACYEIVPSLNMVTFKGVLQADAPTFTLKGRGSHDFFTATFQQTGCPS